MKHEYDVETMGMDEMALPPELEIRQRAKCVWYYGMYTTEERQKKAAKTFGITWEDALKWKDYYLKLREEMIKKYGSEIRPIP